MRISKNVEILMFFKNVLFSACPNVVGVFGESKKFHMVKNTPLGRGEVGATDARCYIFGGKVIRMLEADMYEGLVTMHCKICCYVHSDSKIQVNFSHIKL